MAFTEIIAAEKAGMQTVISDRPGNAALSAKDRANHRVVTAFDQI